MDFKVDTDFTDDKIKDWEEMSWDDFSDSEDWQDVANEFQYRQYVYDTEEIDRGAPMKDWIFFVKGDDKVVAKSDKTPIVFIYSRYAWRRRISSTGEANALKSISKSIEKLVNEAQEKISQAQELADESGISFTFNVGAYNNGYYDPNEGGWTGAWNTSSC